MATTAELPSPQGLPTGTVTFLFTDLEGSTALLQAHPAAYRAAVARHHALLRAAVEASGGVVFETVGDAVYAAFASSAAAVAAARALLEEPAFTAEWAAGRSLPPEQAVAYALEEPSGA